MTFPYAKSVAYTGTTLLWVFGCFWAATATAQTEQVSLTVAPTLVELSASPGEIWRSSIKVVNPNPFPLTVYVSPAHFAPVGEQGASSVVPVDEIPDNEEVLARWLALSEPEVTLPPNSSSPVPFVLTVPDSAAPGSHFGALLVSTVPPNSEAVTGLVTAQVISSLLFVRVAGDITEEASLRSFTASNAFGPEPKSELTVRVENRGNVHIRPVGEILIRNLWGTERGRIPVNVNTSFGNALPEQIREYQFTWAREPSLFDIGRYSADVAVTYGLSEKQFISGSTYFWVIPVKPLLVAIGIIFGIIGFIFLVSRWYITRLLRQAGVTSLANISKPSVSVTQTQTAEDLDLSNDTRAADKQSSQTYNGVGKKIASSVHKSIAFVQALWLVLPTRARYSVLVILVALVGIITTFLLWQPDKTYQYEVTIATGGALETFNSEEIVFMQQPGMSMERLENDAPYGIHVYNASKEVGLAGVTAAALIETFPVTKIAVDTVTRNTSVIVFPVTLEAEAIALSAELSGALLSAADSATATISVFLAE